MRNSLSGLTGLRMALILGLVGPMSADVLADPALDPEPMSSVLIPTANLPESETAAPSPIEEVPHAESNEPPPQSGGIPFNINYYAVFFGPSLFKPSYYQPTPSGDPDLNRPVLMKNFLSLGYSFSEVVNLSLTGFAIWEPALKEQFLIQDPFLMVSHNSILRLGNLNLYGDLRVHIPATTVSQQNNLLVGLQSFQVLSYGVGESRFVLGLNSSIRTNFYGSQGWGTDLEVYVSPNIRYQVSPTVGVAVAYEVQASHLKGVQPYRLTSDGTDIQPGVTWDILPNVTVNPFLTFQTGGKMSFKTTSLGMFLSWGLV